MLKFILRFLFRLTRFAVIDLPLILIGAVLLLIVLPIHHHYVVTHHDAEWKLPWFVRWFDCADLYAKFGRNPVTYILFVCSEGWWKRYTWLAFRNPLNYFSYEYLAITPKQQILIQDLVIRPQNYLPPPGVTLNIGDSTNDVAGLQYVEYKIDGEIYYEYYYVHAYTNQYMKGKCFRIRLGWKLGLPGEVKINRIVQDVFNISFNMSYNGK